MQSPKISISAAAETIETVIIQLKNFRTDVEYHNLHINARELADTIGLEAKFEEVRIRKRTKNFTYEADDDPMEDLVLKFKVEVYNSMLDVAIQSIKERFDQLSHYSQKFGFLHSISKLKSWTRETVLKYCKDLEIVLSENNNKDIDGTELSEELIFIANLIPSSDDPNDILKYIISNNLIPIYPNIYIVLNILLTMPVSVASGERSFSRLKLIKNYLRSTMSQDRLSSLAILSIENDIARELDKDDIYADFSNMKARKFF